MGRVVELDALALRLRQTLVIRKLGDDAGDARAEHLAQFFLRRRGVLDRVVQQRSGEQLAVRHAALVA